MFDRLYDDYFRTMPTWLKKFDRLIFYASDYRDINLAREHGLTNISVLPNGADEREFNVKKDAGFRSRHAIPERAFVVMTVGSITGLKGHVELVEAFGKCDFGKMSAYLLLVGNRTREPGFEEGRFATTGLGRWIRTAKSMHQVGGATRVAKWVLRPVLEKLGLEWLLRALGYTIRMTSPEEALERAVRRVNSASNRTALWTDLPRPEVVQAYLNSNLFAFASKIEYSPLVLFEAAAAGLPFVSAPAGNAAEIARWTGGGVICDAQVDASGLTHVNAADLARHIEILAAQPDVLARLGTSGRRAWEERFSWDTIFRAYEKIFEECLEKTPV
jgi:glycosyltransferase involved in cell wall biosynthesis